MRRRYVVALLVSATLFVGAVAVEAQSAILKLPDVSQHARLTQRIGLTDISIDYHRPLVNGRKIFGGLLAYGKVWRAGANENTIFEVTDAVAINGQPLPKGTYGLHMVPSESAWIVIFSKNSAAWGSFTYDQAEDALRVTVAARTIETTKSSPMNSTTPSPIPWWSRCAGKKLQCRSRSR